MGKKAKLTSGLQLNLFEQSNTINEKSNINEGDSLSLKDSARPTREKESEKSQSPSSLSIGERSKSSLEPGAGFSQDPGSSAKQNGGDVPEGSTEVDRSRDESDGSGRTTMARSDEKDRTRVAIIENYHSPKGNENRKSFNKTQSLRDNIDALTILLDLQNNNRLPTIHEKNVLASYKGFGGIKEILLDPSKDQQWNTKDEIALRNTVQEIQQLLISLNNGNASYLQAARRSVLSAHYTPHFIIEAVYSALQKSGFNGGRILEPAAGIGNFLAFMPREISEKSSITAVEMDECTGKILQKLYPLSEIRIAPFEQVRLPEEHYDLIISNVPFGDVKVYDPQLEQRADKRFSQSSASLHNYFFAKSLLLARPGAIIAMVTSRYTLDSNAAENLRSLIADEALFLGALRLPDTTFKGLAGTEVVADIIFLQKFSENQDRIQTQEFQTIKSIPFTDQKGTTGILSYNEYFHAHPEHMLGVPEFGGLYRKDEFNLSGDPENLPSKVLELCEKLFKGVIIESIQRDTINSPGALIQPGAFESIGNLVALNKNEFAVISNDFYINEDLDNKARELGINPYNIRNNRISDLERETLLIHRINPDEFTYKVVEPVRINKSDQPKVEPLIEIRSLLKELLFRESNEPDSVQLESIRSKLKRAYTNFTIRYGNINSRHNDKLLALDSDCFLIKALEIKDNLTGKISPADILVKRTIHPKEEVSSVEDVSDAILLSLEKYGRLQMSYVCKLLNTSYEDLMATQIGPDTKIFINEEYDHVIRDEYLSGNVVEKLDHARALSEKDPKFRVNVECLEKVQPAPIPIVDIYCPLHASWLDSRHINDFLKSLLQTDNIHLKYSKSLGLYDLQIHSDSAIINAFKSESRSAAWIIEHALNGIEPVVTYTIKEENGNIKTLVDISDTHYAKELYKKVKQEWDDFKVADPDRRRSIEVFYNQKFNNTRLRDYNGAHLRLPGLTGITPRPHQRNAIFRNIQQLGGINDHIVGSGKTLVQICTAMELRRLSICHKPMIIGLKSQIPQFYEAFRRVYPFSRVLFPSEKDFEKKNRHKLLNTIATNDWDAIIITHDQFNMIRQPISIQEKMIDALKKEIEEEASLTDDKKEKKKLENRLYSYEQKLNRLKEQKKDDNVLDFSMLGVDFLMVDESQEFKNLEFFTRKSNIRGIGNPTGSKRAFNMMIACRYLQEFHKGDKGILFASGTPISNTMAELYLLFKYLRPQKMQWLGLDTFDKWAANFANDFSELEYYMGKFKEVHRFREFANLPELIGLYREIADVRNNHNLIIDKPKAEHILVKVSPSSVQLKHIEMLQEFIESKGNSYRDELGLTAGYDYKKKVNPSYAVLAIGYARKLSIDPRLIDPSLSPGSKLLEAADNVGTIYHESTPYKATQLIFCDIGTPKSSNPVDNLFNYLEGDISEQDHAAIFSSNYWELEKKPALPYIKDRLSAVLSLSDPDISNLIESANAKENFNVYAEMKRLLIIRGVPGHQIVFIHDYNTRKAKSDLYEAVNKGNIRLVIGSTKKLGTGTNVQTRCIAGHHLDISWRPSDLEQRNGRFERPGNELAKDKFNNVVKAYYYATERTLDASMYNTVSLKAHFISQMKTLDDPSIRMMKDLEEDVDMGQMAAELSGDPVFKEKATLTKKINEFAQLNRSFIHKLNTIQDELKSSKRLKDYYLDQAAVLNRNIPLLDTLPQKNGELIIAASVKGNTYQKVGEFGKAMLELGFEKMKNAVSKENFLLGELWGFKVIGHIGFIFGVPSAIIRTVVSPAGETISKDEVLPDGEVAAGLQIKNIICGMPQQLSLLNQKIEKLTKDIEDYDRQLLLPNPYKKEMRVLEKRLAEVDNIIVERNTREKPEKTAGEEKMDDQENVKIRPKL
ncbi:Eco57I restriction-modification methylase domain-containing protein [Niabella sp. CJ426]|uniref:Eco57I restriction-modification methylase domain-containing protein n=1 Tax=Niabella sp. CJ426 TaxID=3393740 RepID=UPI003CFCC078